MNLKWIVIKEGVVLTPSTERSVIAADPYFEGLQSYVTSGLRTADHQLEIIIQKAKIHSIDSMFPEFAENLGHPIDFQVDVNGTELYWWQRTWSQCNQIGDIVNPPRPAASTSDYKPGVIIGISDHMKGFAWDLGGGTNLTERSKRIMHAVTEGKCYISNFRIERINNAVHCDVIPI
jgi:hypothetical protein